MSTATRPYRAYYVPLDSYGHPVGAETGILPFVQVQATGAEHAHRAAHHVTGCPIDRVERQDSVAA